MTGTLNADVVHPPDGRESVADEIRSLLDVGREIALTLDSDVIFERVVQAAAELVQAEEGLLLMFNPEEQVLTNVVGYGYPAKEMSDHTYDEVADGMSGLVVATRTGVVSNDIATDPRNKGLAALRASRFPETKVAIAPIVVEDVVLGTLTTLNNAGARKFTELDLSLLEMLAMQAGVAIRNAQLYEDLQASHESLQQTHEELKETQTQLLAAQKLEAIGSLAAGIAHEINTPIQFVSDNTSFIKDAAGTLARFGAAHIELLDRLVDHPDHGSEIRQLRQEWEEEDCDFFLEEVPDAIEETLEGAIRVTEIVRALKGFAHPGSESKSAVDVNRVVETTMQVSRNEWKYYAELELDLDPEMPLIEGHAGPLGQALLILFVNAAQAMAETRSESQGKGHIRVTTSHDEETVEIRVADNGPGIPEDIIDRVFDPFFTTKEVGKGSGQGLSIARSVVVDKHAGEIWIEDNDPGAVFVLRLPVAAARQGAGGDD